LKIEVEILAWGGSPQASFGSFIVAATNSSIRGIVKSLDVN
jgi:hypothetical protein